MDAVELCFSEDALATRSRLYSGLNDINLFVEDTDKEYLYETIFKRLLGERYKITAIFPCGGKVRVIERFHEQGEKIDGVSNIYLVDADFDRIIHQADMIHNPNFIYLWSYNIENYFIDKKAVCEYIKGKIHKVDSEVEVLVDFDNWKSRIVTEAKKLFLTYCYIQVNYPSDPNVARNSNLFLDYNSGFQKSDKSFQEYFSCYKRLDSSIEQKLGEIDSDYHAIYGDDYYHLICGKFLLDSLYYHLRNVTGKQFQKEDMKWSLVTNFDISKLDFIKTAIQNAVVG